MHTDIFQCAVNFSEGRRRTIVEALATAMSGFAGARLIDSSHDYDHNRCVMTLIGNADGIRYAVAAAARIAVERIDLRSHQGVHPRTGSIDVVPVVPLWGTEPEQAMALANTIGHTLAEQFGLPIYFYEWSAPVGQSSALPDLRRGEFEAAAQGSLVERRTPDLGPSQVHPSAGFTIVGARGPLVAYNIDLDTQEGEAARKIAARIREERKRMPELRGVRSLGLLLPSRGCAQVAMNLTHPDRTPLPDIYQFVVEEARKLGVGVKASEIIGAIPFASLGGLPPEAVLWKDYKPAQVLENWRSVK